MSNIILVTIAIAIIAYIIGKPYWREYQRHKIRSRPFNKAWRRIIQRRMPYFRKMPADLQLQLKRHIQVFLSEKQFIGCNGVVITDEIRVTVAAQACLLLLNRPTDYYPQLRSILIYPRAFIIAQQQQQTGGVLLNRQVTLAGESWENGKVILSWDDTKTGADIPDDGHNVVIHEFAHQLDQENGHANGSPILGKNQDYQTWSKVFSAQFEALQHDASRGKKSLFDYYGATNPAEFFAVASEVFFEQSEQFQRDYSDLYKQLQMYYRVDPALW